VEFTDAGVTQENVFADGILAMRDGSQWIYYHKDEGGSVRIATDSDGVVLNQVALDAFGNVLPTQIPSEQR